MATQDSPRQTFKDIDWEKEESDVASSSLTMKVQLGSYVLLLVAAAYDLFVIPDDPFAFGIEVGSVNWLFLVTLMFATFNIAVPLARNRRLTMYYWRQFKKNKAAVLALVLVAIMFVIAVIGPILMDPPRVELFDAHQPPIGFESEYHDTEGSWEYPLGTDQQGRDILTMIVYGMRVSFQVGLIATFISIVIATVVGTTAAHFGGLVDEVLMRYVDIQATFPTFLFLLLIIYLYSGSLIMIIVLFGFFGWEGQARLIRSEALQRTEEAYVQAAEAAGATRAWVVRRHIIPNVSSTAITAATLLIPGYMLGEANLSFLGFTDEFISWGLVIADGKSELDTSWWIATIPGVFLFATVLALNYVGDAIRDAADPRQDT